MKTVTILIFFAFFHNLVSGQVNLTIYPDSLIAPLNVNFTPGVFYVPKTEGASIDFNNNNIRQNSIRTHVIEIILNSSTDLTSSLALLSTIETELLDLSLKCEKLIFIFEKMPVWLSSSADGSPAATPGWSVLNTKKPANWDTWQTVVESFTAKIINDFGIDNAYFEVWNEPDIGSWTDPLQDYFTLYQRTYDGIKAVNPNAKVGGPTVNFWANNIYWQPPYGYVSPTAADSSLIGQLLDSAVVWNKIPDFISWHNFNLSYQEFGHASNYIQQKITELDISDIPLIVSEWNAPSQVRDTRLATSFMIKTQIELSRTPVSNNVIAAWQDFSPSIIEFHNDYGLLSYGEIHKPAYNGILLSEKMNGTNCKMIGSAPFDAVSSTVNDTLFVLISNYCPLPLIEALNHTLYQGQFNINQLDAAGYIDIEESDVTYLDSIYRGLITIPDASALQIAINNSIEIYEHYAAIATTPRVFNMTINGYTSDYDAQLYIVDSTQNNLQYKYDSLRTMGFTQEGAILEILPNQGLNASDVNLIDGQYTLSMQPNSVALFKINAPVTGSINQNNLIQNSLQLYPNPASENLTIILPSNQATNSTIEIFDTRGNLVKTFQINSQTEIIDISQFSQGLYFVRLQNEPNQAMKFFKW